MIPILWRASARDLTRHRWQSVLSILGIALGVAVVIAVDIANESARRAFELSVEQVSGRATHQIEAASGRLSDDQFTRLAPLLDGLDASPVIESTVRIDADTFTLLGADPLALARLNPVARLSSGISISDLLTEPGALLLSRESATRLGARPGDGLELMVSGQSHPASLVGIIESDSGESSARLDGLAIADIASAQELTGQIGWIDRVDLALTPDQAAVLARKLPAGFRLVPAASRGESLQQMTQAFRTNLTAMSLLAVLVGGFIVYNTMTFAVLRRRTLLGSLRTLGCTRGQIFILVLSEALALALIGSLIGAAIGILAGWGLVQLVTRTINDIYFTLTVGALHISASSLTTGIAMGLSVALVGALGPGTEAARAEPRDLLRPSTLERRSHRWILGLFVSGLALIGLGYGLAQIPSRSVSGGFLTLFLVVVGFSLCVPLLLNAMAFFIGRVAALNRGRPGALPVLLAARGVESSITRTGIAAAALTVAIASSVGVGIMIDSFRGSLVLWLETTLSSDFYVSAPNETGDRPGGQLPAGLPAQIAAIDGVSEISLGRRAQVTMDTGPIALLALEPSSRSRKGFRFNGDTATNLWPRFESGELIMVSEPFAYHQQVQVGDQVSVFTPTGWQRFTIGALFQDYGSDRGMVMMARDTYATLWEDLGVGTLGVVLSPNADPDLVEARLRALTQASDAPLLVSRNREIRDESLVIFDRTFAVTQVLRLLAVAVAFVGVLSTLMALQIELRRDHAVLRATGMTPMELGILVLTQTSILGLSAGLFALPLGIMLGALLIDVINVRSFGWTMALMIPISSLVWGLLLAWIAALMAGIYPALGAAQVAPAQALRSE